MILDRQAAAGIGRRQPRFNVVAVTIAALVVGGCLAAASTAAGSRTAAKPVLHIGGPLDPVSRNPALNVGGTFLIMSTLAYAPIIHMTAQGALVPGLATSWRYVKTKAGPHKLFEFTLRHDARFSDGEAVTADAVTKWLTYFAKAAGPISAVFGPNPSFQAVGKWTVRLGTTIPNPNIPLLLSEQRNWGSVAAPKAVDDPSLFAGGSYGAGPYMLDAANSVTGDHYTFVPNPYYYKKATIKWSQVVVKVIASPSTTLQALQSGQLDVALGDPTTVAAAKSQGFKVVSAPVSTQSIGLSDLRGTMAPPLADVRVRQALNYAVDRKAITKALLGSYGTPTSETLTTDGAEAKYQNYYPYNPTKAKSLLASAGYANGFTLKIAAGAYQGILGAPFVQAVAKYLEAVGVHVDITVIPTAGEYVNALRSAQYPAFENTNGNIPAALQYPTLFHPNALLNAFHYLDPVIAKLYYKGLKAANPSVYWKQIYERATKQAYQIPILSFPNLYYVSKKVAGVETSAKAWALVFPLEWSPA